MIRYAIADTELEARIDAAAPGWRAKAEARTKAFRAAGRYDETSAIWSEIKAALLDIQKRKCAFCERKLEGEPYGLVESDVEHFRPKNEVPAWPTDAIVKKRRIAYDFGTGRPYPSGYYLLAYALLNYSVACKACNTPLKSNFFPIAAKRRAPSDDPRKFSTEQPFLLYPIGDVDPADPEQLITFEGLIPVPRLKSGPRRRRAIVTIDFFELDTREELLRGRAMKITALWMARDKPQNPVWQGLRATYLSAASEHANCTRAFDRLCDDDPTVAERVFDEAAKYLASQS